MNNLLKKSKETLRKDGLGGLIIKAKNYTIFKLSGGKIKTPVDYSELSKRIVPKVNRLLTLDERKELTEWAMKKDKKLALYFVEDTISPQFRYRCENVLEATLNSKKWQAVYFVEEEAAEFKKLLDKSTLVVIERQSAWKGSAHQIVDLCKKKGIKVAYDVDDLVFDLRDLKLLMSSINAHDPLYWWRYVLGVRRIAKKADVLIVTNDFLGKRASKSLAMPYKVIRNSLNMEQLEASEKCLKDKKHEGFRVGYFSGSPTHEKDFALVAEELSEFLMAHKDATLSVVGYMELKGEAERLRDAGQVKYYPMVDFLQLQQLMSDVDVNIAPLVVNDFTNCKSELKFFEAGACETTTIASPTYTFKKAISNGENGFLCKPGEWRKTLEYLYKSPLENKKVAKRARKYCLEHYAGKEFLEEIEKAYDGIVE